MRWFALAVAMLVIPMVGVPIVSAQTDDTDLTEKEVVIAKLDEAGGVVDVELNNWIRAEGNGRINIEDAAILTDITGEPRARVDGTSLSFASDLKGPLPVDFYYRGKATVVDPSGSVQTPRGIRRLPVSVETTFTFNGTEVEDLSQIAGLGGEFEMQVTVSNVTGQAQEVTYTDSTSGKEVTDVGFVFVPLTVTVGPYFFEDEYWKDIEVEGARLARRGTGSEIQTTAVLFPPTTPGEMTMSIKGRTKSFRLNSGRITAVPGIGTTQPESVQDAQELGGGATTALYDALQQFLDGFVKLTDPEEGLPFAADGADRIIKEGLFVLRDTLVGVGEAIDESAIPGVRDLYAGLTDIRDAVRDDLAPGLGTIRDVIGTSNYQNPICRDLPLNRSGACKYSQDQLTDIPPMPALNDTFALYGNADTRGYDPDRFADGDAFLNAVPYNYQLVQRTRAGEVPGEFKSGAVVDGDFFGSLFNWATMIKWSVQSARDADGDGNKDFADFVWPDPDAFPQFYTGGALGETALATGAYVPGFTATGGEAGLPFAIDLCQTVAGINNPKYKAEDFAPGAPKWKKPVPGAKVGDPVPLDNDITGENLSSAAYYTCGDIPASDVTLKDLLKDRAQDHLNDLPIIIDWADLIGLPTIVPEIQDTVLSGLDQLEKRIKCSKPSSPSCNLSNPASWDGLVWKLAGPSGQRQIDSFFDNSRNSLLDLEVPVARLEVPLPVGKALAGGSNKGIYNSLNNPDQLYLEGYNIGGSPGDEHVSSQPINIPVQRSTCLTTGHEGITDTVGLNIGELLGVSCALAHSGPLGMVEAASTVMQNLLSSPGWNFDNWLRGDPGYQVEDLGITGTGPKFYEALNIIAYSLDRKDALCPSTLVTSSDGTGTPRIVKPELTTPCDKVLPDSTLDEEDPTRDPTMVGALTNLILPGVGTPDDPQYEDNGDPANLATLLVELVKGLTGDISEAVGTDDPADAGVTLAGSLAAIRDGLAGAAEQLQPAVTGTPLLIGAVGGVQIEGDLNTALSKAGLERAEAYSAFMGAASDANGDAEGIVIFVLETVGVKP